MDGIHDLGGKHGHGKVQRPAVSVGHAPAFHARWEASVFAMVGLGRATGAWTNSDRFRHAIERIDPVNYLADTYYGRWLGGIETLLVEAGLLDSAEVAAKAISLGASPGERVAARPVPDPDPVLAPADAATARRQSTAEPRFAPGDHIRTVATVVSGHTRLPAYARDKPGHVLSSHGHWVFPDTNAHGLGESPCELYTVAFDSQVLWGDSAEPGVVIHIDLFEPYLILGDQT